MASEVKERSLEKLAEHALAEFLGPYKQRAEAAERDRDEIKRASANKLGEFAKLVDIIDSEAKRWGIEWHGSASTTLKAVIEAACVKPGAIVFEPTGEVRPPKPGEFITTPRGGFQDVLYEFHRAFPIYRRIDSPAAAQAEGEQPDDTIVEYDGKRYRREAVARCPKKGEKFLVSYGIVEAGFDYSTDRYHVLHEITEPLPPPVSAQPQYTVEECQVDEDGDWLKEPFCVVKSGATVRGEFAERDDADKFAAVLNGDELVPPASEQEGERAKFFVQPCYVDASPDAEWKAEEAFLVMSTIEGFSHVQAEFYDREAADAFAAYLNGNAPEHAQLREQAAEIERLKKSADVAVKEHHKLTAAMEAEGKRLGLEWHGSPETMLKAMLKAVAPAAASEGSKRTYAKGSPEEKMLMETFAAPAPAAEDTIAGFPIVSPNCQGCGRPLRIETAWMADGCPCNSGLGVNSMNETRWRLLMELQQSQSRAIDQLNARLSALQQQAEAWEKWSKKPAWPSGTPSYAEDPMATEMANLIGQAEAEKRAAPSMRGNERLAADKPRKVGVPKESDSFLLADRIVNWIADQSYQGQCILHGAVACDFVGRTRFVKSIEQLIEPELTHARDVRELANDWHKVEHELDTVKQENCELKDTIRQVRESTGALIKRLNRQLGKCRDRVLSALDVATEYRKYIKEHAKDCEAMDAMKRHGMSVVQVYPEWRACVLGRENEGVIGATHADAVLALATQLEQAGKEGA